MIELADGLSLEPADAATQRFAWIGTSGAGKTYSCGRFVEQAHEAHIPQLVVDTVGVWAAIRLSADGKGAGLPFAVIGGEHADVPLDPSRYEALAKLIASERSSFVLDLSDYGVNDRAAFAAPFFDALLRTIRKAPVLRMVHLDEAQDLAPQNTTGQIGKMVASVSAFVRKARNHLCGVSLLTQRPQSVHKEVLDLCNNVFLGSLQGRRARKAVVEWIESNELPEDTAKLVLRALPTLRPGEFYFCSPAWLRRFERIHVLPKRTYDGSSTKRLSSKVELAAVAPVDVAALRALLAPEAELVGEATDDDGSVLSPRLSAEVEQRLGELERELEAASERYQELDRQQARRGDAAQQVQKCLHELGDALGHVETQVGLAQQALDRARRELSPLLSELPAESAGSRPVSTNGTSALLPPLVQHALSQSRQSVPAALRAPRANGIGGSDQAVLRVLYWEQKPCSKRRLALLSGYSSTGGGFNNILGRLRSAGWVTGSAELSITRAGRSAIPAPSRPPTGPALFEFWLAHERVKPAMAHILNALRSGPRGELDKGDLAFRAGQLAGKPQGYAAGGGGFNNDLGRLRTLGLVLGKGKEKLRLAPELLGR